METAEILETIRQKVADGDRKGAEEFLFAHFKELPEDLQGDLLIEFIKDAAEPDKVLHAAQDVADAAMKVIDKTEAAEKMLEAIPDDAGESATQ